MSDVPHAAPARPTRPSRLRRVITAVSLTSLAVYSLQIICSPSAEAKPPRTKKAFVRAETARLRSGPGTHTKMVGLLDAGRKAKVIGRDGNWVKVKLESGTTGWLRADLVKVSKKATRDSSSAASRQRRRSSDDEDDAPRRTASARKRRSGGEDRVAKAKPAPSKSKKRATTAVAAKPKPVAKRKPVVAKAKPTAVRKPVAVAAAAVRKPVTRAKAVIAAKAVRAPKPSPVAVAAPKPAAAQPVARPVVAPVVTATVKPGRIAKPAVPPASIKPAPFKLVRTVPVVKTAAPAAAPSKAAPAPAEAPAPATVAPSLAKPVPPLPAEVEAPPVHEGGEVIPEGGTAATPAQLEGAIRVALATEAAKTSGAASVDRSSSRRDRLVRRAMSYRGTPYRMGATGRGAFDCSGYVQYLYKREGEALPRTAAQQYRTGTPVPKEQLKAGDLVFFKNTYKRGVSHVGIYVGEGKFIHASSRGGVKVNSLSQAYYINHWAGARRPR